MFFDCTRKLYFIDIERSLHLFFRHVFLRRYIKVTRGIICSRKSFFFFFFLIHAVGSHFRRPNSVLCTVTVYEQSQMRRKAGIKTSAGGRWSFHMMKYYSEGFFFCLKLKHSEKKKYNSPNE